MHKILLVLSVNKPPAFVTVPEHTNVTEGDNVELTCTASGKPVPEILWYKDGKILNEDDHVIVESTGNDQNMECISKLSLRNILPGVHSGKYTMEAVNSVGKAKEDVYLKGNYITHHTVTFN